MADDKLADLRRRLDAVDDRIVELLNQRAQLNLEVKRAKGDARAAYAPARENEILRRLERRSAGGPFPAEGLRAVYREILSACRSLQRTLRVAYCGPEHGAVMQAALRHFGNSMRYHRVADVQDLVEAVAGGSADYGVAPLIAGARGRDDLPAALLRSGARICAQVDDGFPNDPTCRVVGRDISAPSGHDITAVALSLDDYVGALRDALAILACHRVSLENIASRPIPALEGRMVFFLEVSGHPEDPAIAQALTELRQKPTTTFLEVIGAWPA